jgi:hypothetical protein
MKNLDTIITQLEQESQKKDNRYLSYWTAYANYKKALSLLEGSKNDEKAMKNGQESMKKAIKILTKIKNKTSEDYALLSLIKNYSIAFSSPVKVPFISGEAKKIWGNGGGNGQQECPGLSGSRHSRLLHPGHVWRRSKI